MSDSCCHPEHQYHGKKPRFDYLLWGSLAIIAVSYVLYVYFPQMLAGKELLQFFMESNVSLIHEMFWGITLGIVFVGILGRIPDEITAYLLGPAGTFSGIVRASIAGIVLDLCSHGILLVGMQLYKKGASLGQTMAFLIASPWNSLSLTLILWALIGLPWTLAFLGLSMVVAIISGLIFDRFERAGVLMKNPKALDLPSDYSIWGDLKEIFAIKHFTPASIYYLLRDGLSGSRMVLRWIFFGIVLAAAVRTFMSPELFQTYFGPSLFGLGLTVLIATIMEVCSEGSTPVAADLLTRAGAPGNSFAFLMTGVATDYTEIASIKETTGSWKTAFFLPLVTVPQVLVLAWLMNQWV